MSLYFGKSGNGAICTDIVVRRVIGRQVRGYGIVWRMAL
jgi:hypothetical protein